MRNGRMVSAAVCCATLCVVAGVFVLVPDFLPFIFASSVVVGGFESQLRSVFRMSLRGMEDQYAELRRSPLNVFATAGMTTTEPSKIRNCLGYCGDCTVRLGERVSKPPPRRTRLVISGNAKNRLQSNMAGYLQTLTTKNNSVLTEKTDTA